ncbi:endonuclease/exonuclease/phosphatase family protein [Deinococcus sp. YIM 77859]|uniref:endonuclease/exonuclease/phosphatase family protein n=1 Tax=Deinococcus sp. YIM 77859 TaxID=1540221 RepID=UPI0005561E4A|nr:endonuclease/exonuclease/phosphatase family protein [Deinococcus sp. YIM 77859]
MTSILTLNLMGYAEKHGVWAKRRGLIERALADTQPDIIALQAVALDPAQHPDDQASQLAASLGYQAVFVAAQTHADGRQDGLAFLTRGPLPETRRFDLSLRPGLEDTSRRVMIGGRFATPQGPLDVFNAHFSWVPEQQEDNVREALSALEGTAGAAAVLVGDFNMQPDSPYLGGLREAEWIDAWALLHPQEQGFTFVEDRVPSIRIDYVWTRGMRARELTVVLAEGEGAARASDHAGLLARLERAE